MRNKMCLFQKQKKNSEIYFADNIVKYEINSQNLLLPKLDINIQTKNTNTEF